MTETGKSSARLEVGSILTGIDRLATAERAQWYGDGLVTASSGELMRIGVNIHTDEDYARSQGLSTPIIDGMLGCNWIASMLVQYFGEDFLSDSELTTKFIKPIYVGTFVRPRGQVREMHEEEGGVRYLMDVWCEDENGTKRTIGTAAVKQSTGV